MSVKLLTHRLTIERQRANRAEALCMAALERLSDQRKFLELRVIEARRILATLSETETENVESES